MIDLENWIRRNGNGTPTTYWGYAQPGSDTSKPVWSIRRLISDSGDQIHQYADDDFKFDKIWDDRIAYFAVPSSAPTLSDSGATTYHGISRLHFKWELITGVSKYYITVNDPQNNIIGGYNNNLFPVDKLGINPQITIASLASETEYIIKIRAWNRAGEKSSIFTITTP
jgi:hypothetical protein